MVSLVDTVIEDPRWESLGLEPLVEHSIRTSLAHLGLPLEGISLCVMGCDDARILALNSDFLGKAKPTNVLSWPSFDLRPEIIGARPDLPPVGSDHNPEMLGDIALSYETCALEAIEQYKFMADHATHLIVHGLLHLLGYDHVEDQDAAIMEQQEVEILAKLGLSNPYIGWQSDKLIGTRIDGQ
ncbi:MAG: rRNA maturation RNase YbeY [Paracoccaceae bacterium]